MTRDLDSLKARLHEARERVTAGQPSPDETRQLVTEVREATADHRAWQAKRRAEIGTKLTEMIWVAAGFESREAYLADFRRRYVPWTEEPSGPEYGYFIRTSQSDGKSPVVGSFEMPFSGYVEDPIFTEESRSGIYGLYEGVGDWGRIPQYRGVPMVWQILVVRHDEVYPGDVFEDDIAAHRVPRAWVKYSGTAGRALSMIFPRMVQRIREGHDCKQVYRNNLAAHLQTNDRNR